MHQLQRPPVMHQLKVKPFLTQTSHGAYIENRAEIAKHHLHWQKTVHRVNFRESWESSLLHWQHVCELWTVYTPDDLGWLHCRWTYTTRSLARWQPTGCGKLPRVGVGRLLETMDQKIFQRSRLGTGAQISRNSDSAVVECTRFNFI